MKKIISLFVISTFVLSGCASPDSSTQAVENEIIFDDLASFYEQELIWKECDDDKKFECAKIRVPVDYQNPGNASLTLDLKKLSAKN
jgi:hypothetical protein